MPNIPQEVLEADGDTILCAVLDKIRAVLVRVEDTVYAAPSSDTKVGMKRVLKALEQELAPIWENVEALVEARKERCLTT